MNVCSLHLFPSQLILGRSTFRSQLPALATLILIGILAPLLGILSTLNDASAADAKSGYLIEFPVPLNSQEATKLIAQLEQIAKSAPTDGRLDVILRYGPNSSGGESSTFEDALKVARAITGPALRQLRMISYVEGEVTGHSILPIVASDALLMSSSGTLVDASAGEQNSDDTVTLTYLGIAAKRGLFPAPVVRALVDPDVELAWVSKIDGGQTFAAGDDLVKLRETGALLSDEVWSAAGVPCSLSADQLRRSRIAAGLVGTLEDAAQVLDLAEIKPAKNSTISGETSGVLLEIAGSISRNRVRRWQSNLSLSLQEETVNTWLISIDSIGGDMDQSAVMASSFAIPEPPIRNVTGFVLAEARGDSALMAIACKPLFMKPDAILGGSGADEITLDDLENHDELIQNIARSTRRSPGLIRGLLVNDLEIYRYTNKKTGKIKYASPDDLVADSDEPDLERDRWEKGDRIDMGEGISAEQAIELGLADGISESLEEVSQRAGMDAIPETVSEKGIIRFVERLGRSQGLMMILLLVGFISLSAEMNAPGIGVPGFLALVCFVLFFWMNYLAGTAEWLELVLLALGLVCIALEVFVLPGFGVFGIGGLVMTIASIVLMSQTFVLPQNSYQLTVITRGLWAALGSLMGLFGGFVLMRQLFPHLPLFRHLVMEAPDVEAIDQAEKLVDYSYLLHQVGRTTTPLRPSGKAQFDNQVVQVISDGSMIDKGVEVKVIEVQGAKVVVES